MNKSIRFKIFAAVVCLSMIFIAASISGCSKEAENKIMISRNFEELSLVEMWFAVVDAIDFYANSAELQSLRLHTDKDGEIESLSFDFYGLSLTGTPLVYSACMNSQGCIKWYSYEIDSMPETRDPLRVFSQIDKVGLSSLIPGEAGLSLQIGFIYGSIRYSYDYLDIYHLASGTLKQIEDIYFHGEFSYCTINICKLFPPENVITKDGETIVQSSTSAGPVPSGERTSQIWFLSEDVNMAESVRYLEN